VPADHARRWALTRTDVPAREGRDRQDEPGHPGELIAPAPDLLERPRRPWLRRHQPVVLLGGGGGIGVGGLVWCLHACRRGRIAWSSSQKEYSRGSGDGTGHSDDSSGRRRLRRVLG